MIVLSVIAPVDWLWISSCVKFTSAFNPFCSNMQVSPQLCISLPSMLIVTTDDNSYPVITDPSLSYDVVSTLFPSIYENDYIADIAWINKIRKEKDIKKKEKLEDKYLEREELQTLLNNLTVPRWRMLASFAALSGLRVGEIIALRDSDVNLDKRIISVTKNYDSNNKVIGYTKTSCSYREVYIQDELLTLCRQIRFFIKKEQLLTGVRSPLFIPDVSGDHVHYWAYNKCLKETAHRVLNKDVEITTHVLRHTHVALMAEQLVPLEVISRRIGHADSKVTREIYFHITKKMRERDNQLIRNVKIL